MKVFSLHFAKKMALFYFQVLMHFLLIFVTSKCSGTQTVSATKDEAAVLLCPNTKDVSSCYRVRWIKYLTDTKQTVVLEWPSKKQHAERVTRKLDGNGGESLHLKNLQKSDEGLYSCEIWLGWDRVLVENTTLKVKDCRNLPPRWAQPNSNITLEVLFNQTAEQRPQNVSWAKLKGITMTTVNDSERVKIRNTKMTIQPVILSDAGWYRCNYVLGQTERCSEIQLITQEIEQNTVTTRSSETQTGSSSKEEGSAIPLTVVVPITCGLVVVILIGVFLCHRHSRKKVTRHAPVAITETGDAYESFTLPVSSDSANTRANSLYQCQDESLYTFSY